MRPWEASWGRGRGRRGRGECWSRGLVAEWHCSLVARRVGPGGPITCGAHLRERRQPGALDKCVQARLSEEALGRPGQEQGRGTKAGESLVLGRWPSKDSTRLWREPRWEGPVAPGSSQFQQDSGPCARDRKECLEAGTPRGGSLGWGPRAWPPFLCGMEGVATEISGEQPRTGDLRAQRSSLQRCLPGCARSGSWSLQLLRQEGSGVGGLCCCGADFPSRAL